jgi:hypothetical protein
MSTTTWDHECDALQQEQDLSAKKILDRHGFETYSHMVCQTFNLHALRDISDLGTDLIYELTNGPGLSAPLPVKNRLAILVQKCRLVEGHTYIVRVDMKRSAKDLLFMYGLIEALHISERLNLRTFTDLAKLTDDRINSLDIDPSEKRKLSELCRNCSTESTYAAFSYAQASNIIKYANDRYQIERAFLHQRQDREQGNRKREARQDMRDSIAKSQKGPKYTGSDLNELLCQLHASRFH